jgi:preprotein translocase subunit SecG
VCGRENPASRTFCLACGQRLGSALASGPAGRPVAARPVAPRAGTTGGRPLIIAIAFALVVLVAGAVALAFALGIAGRDGTAAAGGGGATASPSRAAQASVAPGSSAAPPEGSASAAPPTPAPASPEASAPATPSTPAATPAATPTTAPTIPAGNPIGIKVRSARASTQASSALGPRFVIDSDPATAWHTAKQGSAQDWIELAIEPTAVTRLQVWVGDQASDAAYQGNRRPRTVTVRFGDRDPFDVKLGDVQGSQHVDLPASWGVVGVQMVRITIVDWYPARKTSAAGSPSSQTAISEIRIFGVPMP